MASQVGCTSSTGCGSVYQAFCLVQIDTLFGATRRVESPPLSNHMRGIFGRGYAIRGYESSQVDYESGTKRPVRNTFELLDVPTSLERMPAEVDLTTGPAAGPLGHGNGMLDQIRHLTDIGQMTRLLHETIAYERSIDRELEALLGQRYDLDKKLNGLYKASEVLELVRADSDQMLSSVRSTCDLADHVSIKVRELDLAQSRVQATLQKIDVIVDRTSCIDGTKQALDAEDYEAAAKYVETFLQLDEEYNDALLEGAAGFGRGGDVAGMGDAAEQRRQLLESKEKLEALVQKKFSAAVEARDHATVVRFVRLYPPLGLQEEGLRSYVAYLRKVLSLRAKDEYESVVEGKQGQSARRSAGQLTGTTYVEVLNSLFRDIALAIEDNEDLLRDLLGEDAVAYAIRELQEECDQRGTFILKKYMDFRRLTRVSKEISSMSRNVTTSANVEAPDPREIEVYLEEMLLLSQTSEEFTMFMNTRLRESASAGAQLSPRAGNAFKSGVFNRTVQELSGYYIILEEFFMVENVKKAIKIDEFTGDGSTTSMVDDVFYVLQSCSRRAISTSNVQVVIATLNYANNLLNNEFYEALQKKTREPNLVSRLFVGGAGVLKVGTEVATALNNIDVSTEYVLKLKHEIEEHCTETFSAPAEREKIKSCLADLAETSNSFKQLLNASMEQLANSVTPRLRARVDAVGAISYELTEAQYSENEVSDPWVQKLLHDVEESVTWLQPVLTTNNYDSLVHLIIDFLAKRLEAIMQQKRFNQLGGLQLDRDARTLVGHFSGMSQRTVRDKFARLTQIATILNLEKVSEILDYWGENSGPMTWRLTPADVRRILSLRVDFKPEAIAALKL